MKKIFILIWVASASLFSMQAQKKSGENMDQSVSSVKTTGTVAKEFANDTLPTPEYMTMVLYESGVITPEQIPQAYRINKDYDQKVKKLTQNPKVSRKELQSAADEQNQAYKAILSDDQQRAYEGQRQRFQQRNWGYNWNQNNNGSNYHRNGNRWPEWMPMYQYGRGPGEYPAYQYGCMGPGWMM